MALCAIGIYQGELPLWLRYGLCVVFSLIGGILPASVLGASPVLAPRPQLVATTNGLIMQGSNLGQSIGPPALAALAAAVGDWHLSPLVLVTSAAFGIVLALLLQTLERRASRAYDSVAP
jgi:MFS family permease